MTTSETDRDLPPPTAAGKLIRMAREMTIPKLSRPEVAHRTGIDPGTLGNIERGYRYLGDGRVREVRGEAALIAKVAQVLGISPERLEDEGERPDAAALLERPECPATGLHTYMVQRRTMRVGHPLTFSDGERIIAVLSSKALAGSHPQGLDDIEVTALVELPNGREEDQ